MMLNTNLAQNKAYRASYFLDLIWQCILPRHSILIFSLSMYFNWRDFSQHFIALHDSGDNVGNKRSVSEIISGTEHGSCSITSRKLSEFKIQGCLYIAYNAFWKGISSIYRGNAFPRRIDWYAAWPTWISIWPHVTLTWGQQLTWPL